MNGTCRYGARCRFLHNVEDATEVNPNPWTSDTAAASFFSPSASSPAEFDTKIGQDSHGVIGEAKSAGSSREQRHEQAVLSFLGIASSKLQQKQDGICKFSTGGAPIAPSQRTWADLAAKAAKPEAPQMLPPNPTQKPEMTDATFSGLFGASWGTF